MGTNFFLPRRCPAACEHCGLEPLHIGKSSAGWRFGFEAHPELGLTSWGAWRAAVHEAGEVVDEYGRSYTPEEFEEWVENTRKPWGPNGEERLRRDGWDRLLGCMDERFSRDADGWDFWEGPFS